MPKLHEIPKGSKIKAECFNDKDVLMGDMITFHHLDGMFSYCTVDGVEGEHNVVHLNASTSLKKVGNHYEIEH